jgi:predicted DNA-binding transcriptional regulator YafY
MQCPIKIEPMSINERIYRIDQLLNDRKSVSFQELLDRLEVSPATLKRDLAYMRDRLNAPIVYDKEQNGYRFESNSQNYALPGLWFSPEEIYALLTMQHLLTNLDSGGLLSTHIKPLQSRLLAMIDDASKSSDEVKRRVKIETMGARKFNLDHFQVLGSALINRKRLVVEYHARGSNENSNREISPQRIIYYRDNWYLDAWCHLRNGLRSFSIDAINHAEILEKKAENIDDNLLDIELGSGYGIFAGKNVKWATIRFSPERARWVANEKWHPNQISAFLENGAYELKIPFSYSRELCMDILKHGADVTVISPQELINEVIKEAKSLIKNHN